MVEKLKSIKDSDILTQPITCKPLDSSARNIVEKINSSHFLSLPIVANHVLIGIITDWDILQLFIQGENLKNRSNHCVYDTGYCHHLSFLSFHEKHMIISLSEKPLKGLTLTFQ
tara:strand:+ start:272 stop:613 length:342 start_codon:yes stop_codon:yes gene_type:complete